MKTSQELQQENAELKRELEELKALAGAVREAKGRFNTQQACEKLFAALTTEGKQG